MNLDHILVGTSTDMLGESSFMSKNPPSISDDEKSTDCSTLISCSTYFVTFVVFFQHILPPLNH
jgi:hypothetical protein